MNSLTMIGSWIAELALHERAMQAGWWSQQQLEHRQDAGFENGSQLAARGSAQGRRALAHAARGQALADPGELGAEDFEVERLLGTEMVVAGGDVGAGELGDVTDRGAVQPLAREELGRGREQPVGGSAEGGGRGHERAL
jgi:hypothetical protein